MTQNKFVKDAYGHVYIYIEAHHHDRIGAGLEFVVAPVAELKVEEPKPRTLRTLQELREAAAKIGLDIPDGTPFAKAQSQYSKALKAKAEEVSPPLGLEAFDAATAFN